MGARLMNALGASKLERTICASAGIAGTLSTHGLSPEVDPEEWQHARYVLIWGWNPMSTAPHLWRSSSRPAKRRQARRRRSLPQPNRARGRRAHPADAGTDGALALGMMRAIVDAGLARRGVVPRAHRSATTSSSRGSGEIPVERCARSVRRAGRQDRADRARVRAGRSPRCCASESAPSATSARRSPTARSRACRRSREPGATAGGGCSYIPTATASAGPTGRSCATTCEPASRRTINMSQLGRRPHGPRARPAGRRRSSSGTPTRRRSRPTRKRCCAGCAARTLLRGARAVHDRHGRPRRCRAASDDPARAPRRRLLLGPPLPDLERAGDRAGGEAKPNSETFGLIAARMGLDDPASPSARRLLGALLASPPAGSTLDGLRESGWAKIDLGQGPTPHAEGGFRTAVGQARIQRRLAGGRGIDPLPFFDPPAETPTRARRALPARPDHAEDAPVPELDLRQPARQQSAQPEP